MLSLGMSPRVAAGVGTHTSSIEPAPGDADPFAVVNVAYISPSALETFDMCERKWAWSKLDRVPKIMGDSAALGDRVHKQHERWLGQGVPYDLSTREGALAMATMHLLPAPGVAVVEQEVIYDFPTPTGPIRLGGKLDANWLEQPGPHPVVLDHKTTGSIGFRKDTLQKLLDHPQAPIYATWALEFGNDGKPSAANVAELRWNYVDTKPKRPMAYPSWHTVSRELALGAMDRVVVPVAKRLAACVEQANAERRAGRPFSARHLPMNTNACSAFGGCQFRSRCSLSPAQEFNAHMTQAANSFLSRIGVTPGGASPAPAPVAAPVAATTVNPPAAPTVAQPLPAQAPVAAPVAAWTPPGAGSPATQTAASTGPVEGYGAAINPPESNLPAPATAPTPLPAEVEIAQTTIAPAGKPKKAKAPSVINVAPEAPATPSNPFGSVLAAVLQGLCANPALAFIPADQLVNRAAEITKGVSQ